MPTMPQSTQEPLAAPYSPPAPVSGYGGARVKLTRAEAIKGRIAAGRKTMEPFANKAQNVIARFLDSDPSLSTALFGTSGTTGELLTRPEGGMLDEGTEGRVNYLLINVLVKIYSIAINDPDFDVTPGMLSQEGDEDMTREAVREIWDKNEWVEADRLTELMKDVCGMGFQSWFWNEAGPNFECVMPWDMSVDPHVTPTSWHKLRYFAYRTRLPRETAEKMYPNIRKFLGAGPKAGETDYERSAVEVWVYFDKTTEAHMYQGREPLLITENLCKEVPLLTLKGEPNPLSPFRLGDVDIAAPQQELLSDLADRMNDQAKNGGSVTFINGMALGDEQQRANLDEGMVESLYEIEGSIPANECAFRLPADPLNPALLEAWKLARTGVDESTGVNEYQRGVLSSDTKTATEASLLAQQSGARGIAARVIFERFVQQKAKKLLYMLREFSDVETDEDYILWEAISAIQDIRVIESSTTYQNPALEQQSQLQVFQLFLEGAPVMMQVAGFVPNLRKMAEDVLRAFQKRDLKSYFLELPPPMPMGGDPNDPNAQNAQGAESAPADQSNANPNAAMMGQGQPQQAAQPMMAQ